MKTEFEYIKFSQIGDTGKTTVWSCTNIKYHYILGMVKWYFGWRQYVFIPQPGMEFSAGCLIDISSFISQLMKERGSINE